MAEEQQQQQRQGETSKSQRINQEQDNPRPHPPVTRSMSRGKDSHGKAPAADASKPSGSDAGGTANQSDATAGGLIVIKHQPRRAVKLPARQQGTAKLRAGKRQTHTGLTSTTNMKRKAAASKPQSQAASGPGARARKHAAAHERLKKMLQPRGKALLVPVVLSKKPVTIPDDVELQTSKRTRATEEVPEHKSPFKPLALKVAEFQKKTPSRFRTKPGPPPEHKPLSMTQAQEPQLMTSMRVRPSTFKTREDLEAEELATMPKWQALPLNTAVLSGSTRMDVRFLKEHEAPQRTEPQPFNFVTDDRAERRRAAHQQREQNEKPPEFKAAPLKRSILEQPVGIPEKRRASTTVPKSPLLRTKLRSHEVHHEEPKHEFHARPVPEYLSVPQEFHREAAPPLTDPQPFNLQTERRGRAHQQAFKARLEQLEKEEKELRIPKAQLLPASVDHPIIPPKPEPRNLTIPQPFQLRSESRHQDFVSEFSRELQQEEEAKRAEAEFKARPVPKLDKVFTVQSSDKPLTVPEDISFTTDTRVEERKKFNQAMEEKMRAIEEQKRREEEERQLAEEQAKLEFRKQLHFEARPVPDFSKPFMALPSGKKLTCPHSPKLGRKKKNKE